MTQYCHGYQVNFCNPFVQSPPFLIVQKRPMSIADSVLSNRLIEKVTTVQRHGGNRAKVKGNKGKVVPA